jgi:methionyl-tRNA formyltransferase
VKALLFAYSEIGATAIETILELGEPIVGVVTHADDPRENRWYRSVAEVARSHGIEAITPENPNTTEILAWGKTKAPDIVLSFYYRKLLKKSWLELAPLGAYNLHGSLLPKFRGRACVNWAIIEGAMETGVTLHAMTEKADAGDIIAQERVPIGDGDTAKDVFDKLVPATRRLLARTLPLLREGRAPRTPQNEAEATTFGARRPEDGRIDWKQSAQRVHNLVRAVTRPYPGAFTFLGGKKLFVWKGRALPEAARGTPGQVLEPRSDGVPVVTGAGLYLVREVQWEGGPIQPATEVLRPSRKPQAVLENK